MNVGETDQVFYQAVATGKGVVTGGNGGKDWRTSEYLSQDGVRPDADQADYIAEDMRSAEGQQFRYHR